MRLITGDQFMERPWRKALRTKSSSARAGFVIRRPLSNALWLSDPGWSSFPPVPRYIPWETTPVACSASLPDALAFQSPLAMEDRIWRILRCLGLGSARLLHSRVNPGAWA
jgi:hypothetical protein